MFEAMALPDIADIAAASKRKRREMDVLTSCYESLVSIDEFDLAKVPKEAKECWLLAKFGLDKMVATREMVIAVPESLTDAQREEVLSDSHDAACALIAAGFDHLLTETIPPPTPILASPHQNLLRMWKTVGLQP